VTKSRYPHGLRYRPVRRWRRQPNHLQHPTTLIPIHPTDAGAGCLERAFRRATHRKLLDRLQIVGLAHRGREPQDIAADLGITPRTVQRWLNAYLEGDLAGLTPRKAQGDALPIPAEMGESRNGYCWRISSGANRATTTTSSGLDWTT
jgi:hypothetical protein